MAAVTPEMVEKARIHEANELLRKLSREVFEDGIDIERLPHAVDLVMNYSESAVQDAVRECNKHMFHLPLCDYWAFMREKDCTCGLAALRENYGVKP